MAKKGQAESSIAESVSKEEFVKEEYASLKEDFSQIIERGIRGFQEKTPGRQVEYISMRLQSRYGFIVQTNKRGLIEIPEMSGMEIDNNGNIKRQRMYAGINCTTTTNQTVFTAVTMLRPGQTTVKEFEANAGAYELLKICATRAQQLGEETQRKIDEKEEEYFPRSKSSQNLVLSDSWEINEQISIDRVFGLVSLARQTLKTELGAKLADCKIVFFHIVDTMELSCSNGNKIDTVVPRTGISIQLVTNNGNELIQSIRGTGGLEAIGRKKENSSPEEAVQNLSKKIAKYAKDTDRAQPVSVLDGEAHIILDGSIAGILAHEVYGHTSEMDIIIDNKRDKDTDLSLKGRLGSQVSENKHFSIIDDGHKDVQLGNTTVYNCFGSIIVDEEGTPAQRTELVKNGIQQLVLNSADTFHEGINGLQEDIHKNLENSGLTGNLRSERYDKCPMVRMTNTFIVPNEKGPKSVEDAAKLIPKNKKGVYLRTCAGGWVETDTGDFEITGELGYLIENGIITEKPVKNVIIHGNIMKFGNKIKAVCSSATLGNSSGYCGKNSSWVPVDDGGPAILLENVSVGEEKPSWYWKEVYQEYTRQMDEVLNKKRSESEVHFKFIEEATGDISRSHKNVCLLAKSISIHDEVKIIAGDAERADFIINEDGTLGEK